MISRPHGQALSRRRLLQFLAASPLLPREALAQARLDPAEWAPRDLEKLIADPTQALDVFDFEPVMRKNVPPAHFGYVATGADDEMTLRANREAFRKFELRPRRLTDVSKVDMSVSLLGTVCDSPIVIAPAGSNRAFHPDAEIAVAKAARTGNHLQILSTVATTSIEDAIAARGAPVWFQLYTTQRLEIGQALAKRAEAAGAPVIVVTLDVRSPAKWETLARLRRTDTRDCGSCHGVNDYLSRKPNFSGIEMGGVSGTVVTNLTWDSIKRLRDTVKVKLALKGILTAEDATLAREAGIDAIVVSNHGGRVEDGVSATIDVLPEIVGVAGSMPVLVDSGFRRGSDIVKALAIGAKAVCIGRPYLWGLGAFGQPGVERVLAILRAETRLAMQQLGAASLEDITPAMVKRVG
ncbi:MAG TPA: alpha-hydroxy acid oxidase [Bradyrhizobium sp.]|nr:alpha-hydroxy acid oxidase [Bradyrhizobium sp.]